MDLGASSRYAVLEDDYEGRHTKLPPTPQKQPPASKSNSNNGNKKHLNKQNTNMKKIGDKSSRRGIDPELQNMAFGMGRPKKNSAHCSSSYSQSQNLPLVSQEEETRRRQIEDDDLQFEKELEQALILSRLEHEANEMTLKGFQAKNSEGDGAIPQYKAPLYLQEFDTVDITSYNTDKYLRETTLPLRGDCNSRSSTNSTLSSQRHRGFGDDVDLRCIEMQKEIAAKTEIIVGKDEKMQTLVQKLSLAYENNALLEEEVKKLRLSSPAAIVSKLENQIEELIKENGELTQEVAGLHVTIEQERSKNHILSMKLFRIESSRKDSK